jgi:hypothetical protein
MLVIDASVCLKFISLLPFAFRKGPAKAICLGEPVLLLTTEATLGFVQQPRQHFK